MPKISLLFFILEFQGLALASRHLSFLINDYDMPLISPFTIFKLYGSEISLVSYSST